MADVLDLYEFDEQLTKRITVLRRYRRMLELQRDRLQGYLHLIDQREDAIHLGDVNRLETYTQQEQQVLKGVMAVQRCLEPLAVMYRDAEPEGSPDIDELHDRLEALRLKILARNAESRSVLKMHMENLRQEISHLKIPRAPVAVFANAAMPQLVNVVG